MFFAFIVVVCLVAALGSVRAAPITDLKKFAELKLPAGKLDVVEPGQNVRRRLADAFYATITDYTDSGCKTATGSTGLIAVNTCISAYLGSGAIKSAMYVGTLTGSAFSVVVTGYASTDCSGSGTSIHTVTGTTGGTCNAVDSSTGLYQTVTTQTSAPSASALGVGYYQMGFKDSACATLLSGTGLVSDKCILSGTAASTYGASSQKLTVSGTTGTVTEYSTVDCTGTASATSTLTIGDTCKAGTTYSASAGDGISQFAYQTVGQTTAAASSDDKATCFASSETVQLEDGSVKALGEVQLGDRVLTAGLDGSLKGYSAVIAVPHAGEESVRATFSQLTIASGKDVRMTRSHLVLSGSCSLPSLPLVQAGSVQAGDCVQTVSGKEQVTAVSTVQGQGIASAVTAAGDLIVVNGVVASPFAINHAVPEAWYSIHRLVYALFPALLGNKLFQQTSERFGDLSVQFSL